MQYTLVPTKPEKESLWITYVGDSVVRDLFHAGAQRFGGYHAFLKSEQTTYDTLKPMHLGPVNEDAVNTYHNTYHTQQLMCCKGLNFPVGKGNLPGSENTCVFALHSNSAKDNEESLKRYKLYLFDDMAEYIRDFIAPLFDNNYKCLSMVWAPDFEDAHDSLKDLTGMAYIHTYIHTHISYIQFIHVLIHIYAYSYIALDDVYPDAVIFNMGLHEAMHSLAMPKMQKAKQNLNKLIELTDKIVSTKTIAFLYHSETYVDIEAADGSKNLQEPTIERINEIVENAAQHSWGALDGYLDIYNYTKGLRDVHGCGRDDGVHFEPLCNYQAIVSQFDFNWLVSLGVVEPSQDVRVVAHPDAPNEDDAIFTQPGAEPPVRSDHEGQDGYKQYDTR